MQHLAPDPMMCKDKLEAYLRDCQVLFKSQHHRTAFTAQEVAASEHVSGEMMAKVIIADGDGRMVMLVLPTSHRVDLTRLRQVLAAKEVGLAAEPEIAAAFPDCETGVMPPFGNLYNVPVYVDPTLVEEDVIVFQAGTHTDTMRIKYADFERLVHPTTALFASHTREMLRF